MKKLIAFLFLLINLQVLASGEIEILAPVIRSTPPGMDMSVAFLKIVNNTKDDFKIIRVSGNFAKSFELHNMQMIEGRMQMRPIDSILVKRNSSVELKSGGYHIMVFGIKKTLVKGEHQKFSLILDNKKAIEVNATIE
jgi:copper(I)-binding protein